METIFGIPANSLLIALLILLGIIVTVLAYTAVRYRVPFRLGMRNLSRRKSQTTLIVSGLALSTLIITSALAIGDTVDYSVKSGVYDDLGAIDEQISATAAEQAAGLGFGSGGPVADPAGGGASWFAATVADRAANLVDGTIIDGVAGLALPVGLESLDDRHVLVNRSLADSLDVEPGDELLLMKGTPEPVVVSGIVADGELAGAGPAVLWSLASAQRFFEQQGAITDIFVSNAGDAEEGPDGTAAAVAALEGIAGDLVINSVKADQLEVAASSAEFITTLFVTFGTFSIFSGILLIFLIFSVLAAERKSELGMGRAVGLQRADLVRQFVTEGFSYNFVAAIIGATLGVLAALLLAGTITGLLGAGDLDITPRVSPRSALIGYSLGLVISFLTITISAVRISRVNIIAAIRDLDLPALPRERQWTLFVRPFTVWRAALARAGAGNRRAALRLFLLAGPKAVLNFWGGLLARGPILIALGYMFAWVGVNQAKQAGVYGMGVALFIIGLGQLIAWLLTSARLAYSFTGLALILYWSLPARDVGRLAELGRNPGDFFISGIFLVGGAIMLFLYNADALLNLFAGLLGRQGRLLPMARVSIAYPVKAKGRTATTLAMFSLVVFTLVSTTTITNTFSNFLNSETGSGGYDVLLQSNPFNPITADEMSATIDELAVRGAIVEPEAFASAVFAPVQAQSPNMSRPAPYAINGVGVAFFASQGLELAGIANTYTDDAAVWQALQTDPTVVVIDNFSIDRTGDPTFQAAEDDFIITGISGSDSEFDPLTIQIAAADGQVREFTVIGVLGSAPSFFGAMMNAEAAAALGFDTANRFFLRLPDGVQARDVANTIEGAFSRSGLETILLKEQLDASRQSIRSIFYLIQGFIGLGLLIGIAALGVITIRAVVERRQQIGVLRAIGFQRRMVQGVFLLEGFFIAGLGTIIGYILALTFAYNLYLQVAADQGLAFLPPWPSLIGIAAAIVVASLLTTWLPARATANVTVAEALRYE
jgi:putative ABC transport system permease protein